MVFSFFIRSRRSTNSTAKKHRTTFLRTQWQHPPHFYDVNAATLGDGGMHNDSFLGLGLTKRQEHDLVEFLKSL